ncbi:MAG: sugar transferase [Parcubacteria group bacterium]|nr:sugar transferase [Parcubacteria group bacterium]
MPFWKRLFDLIFGALGIAALLPLVLVVAPLIRFDSFGPVFVKIRRVSGGKPVHIWKFRTMVANAHELRPQLVHLNERSDGPFFKIANDPRVTRVGRLLRKSLLDEWPQFVNVVRGELTLVGPRAHEPGEVAQYPLEYQHIPQAIAGLTGYSQINGASSLPFLNELEHDAWYLKNQSLWLDLKIIAKTLWLVLLKRQGK